MTEAKKQTAQNTAKDTNRGITLVDEAKEARDSLKTLTGIKSTLKDMAKTAIVQAQERSILPVRVTYDSLQVPQKINTAMAKGYTVNFETGKTSITYYRTAIENVVQQVMGLSTVDYATLIRWVTEDKLFAVYNLWVKELVQVHKLVFFE